MTNAFRSTMTAVALIAGAVGLSAGSVNAQDMPGKGTTIKMAQATWDTGWFQAAIYKQMFEALGYAVEGPTTLDAPIFYQSVAQGDVDLWCQRLVPAALIPTRRRSMARPRSSEPSPRVARFRATWWTRPPSRSSASRRWTISSVRRS